MAHPDLHLNRFNYLLGEMDAVYHDLSQAGAVGQHLQNSVRHL